MGLWVQEMDLNHRLLGYEPNTLPLRHPAMERATGDDPATSVWRTDTLPTYATPSGTTVKRRGRAPIRQWDFGLMH